jgi:hypothetical protein
VKLRRDDIVLKGIGSSSEHAEWWLRRSDDILLPVDRNKEETNRGG